MTDHATPAPDPAMDLVRQHIHLIRANAQLLREIGMREVWHVSQRSATYAYSSASSRRVTREIKRLIAVGLVRLPLDQEVRYPLYRLTEAGEMAREVLSQSWATPDSNHA